jgi:tetrahydromethanopterin S-methyltransferase subunit A
MADQEPIGRIRSELQEGMALAKCQQCGCMKETLEHLGSSLTSVETELSSDLPQQIESWLKQMEPIKYACLGCDYCFPAVAMNMFGQAFPEAAHAPSAGCAFEVKVQSWPPVPGEYFAFCDSPNCAVAVSTLASVNLAETLASIKPQGLCIVGKTETENIGIDKIIKNTITNPAIRVLLLTGQEPKGHLSGSTLLGLWKNGVDEKMRVIGSPGKRPVLRNVTRDEVEAFRKQVQVIDMIGCEDETRIVERLKELSQVSRLTCGCRDGGTEIRPTEISTAPVIQAAEPTHVEMDKAGYFVILPTPEKGLITVEHYSYDNRLLRVIEGTNARSLYWTIIENGWVTQLSHAAYLGKELERAALSMKYGFKYVQDGATGNFYEEGPIAAPRVERSIES